MKQLLPLILTLGLFVELNTGCGTTTPNTAAYKVLAAQKDTVTTAMHAWADHAAAAERDLAANHASPAEVKALADREKEVVAAYDKWHAANDAAARLGATMTTPNTSDVAAAASELLSLISAFTSK